MTALTWHQQSVASGDATIAAESAGAPDALPLLLLNAATWSRDWWPDALCARFVQAGFRVIRFDTRDTGESTAYLPDEADYTAADLVADAVAVLDAHAADRAVVLGMSMGGGLAQALAAAHPDRVATLVLVSTTAADDTDRDLPGPTPGLMTTFTDPSPDPDWTDRDAVVAWSIENERPYAGPGRFDEAHVGDSTARAWDRTPSMASNANHFATVSGAEAVDLAALRGIPTLVVHGSADPMFPLAHGRALADALDVRLLVLDGVGHQMAPPDTWPDLVAAVAALQAQR